MSLRKEKQSKTIETILAGAKAMFEAVGYHDANMRSLCASIGVSTGAVYANFRDKAAVYEAIYGHPPASPEQGRELLGALSAFWKCSPAEVLKMVAG